MTKQGRFFGLLLASLVAPACSDSTTSSGLVGCTTSAECPRGSVCFQDHCATPCEINGPKPEVCDGSDNDCNGQIDEGVQNACGGCLVLTAGLGTLCDGPDEDLCFEGVWECRGKDMIVCNDTTSHSVEICNGRDDDCDQSTDEGLREWMEGSTVGICLPRVLACIDGQTVERFPGVAAQPEVWNRLDDDCNGLVDDNLPLGPPLVISIATPPLEEAIYLEDFGDDSSLEIVGRVDHPMAVVEIRTEDDELFNPTVESEGEETVFRYQMMFHIGMKHFRVSAYGLGREPGQLQFTLRVCGTRGCPRYGATRCQGESTIERCQELTDMPAGCASGWVALPESCPWYGPCVEQNNGAHCVIVGTPPRCGVCYKTDCQGSPWNGYWYSFGAAGGGWSFLCCVGPCSEDGLCPRGTYCSEGRCVPQSFCEWGPCDRECCADPPDPRLIDVNSYCCRVIQQCRGY